MTLVELLKLWQGRLGLSGWDIRLIGENPEPNCRANSDRWAYQQAAVVRIDPEAPRAAWPQLVVHELLHIILGRMDDAMEFATDKMGYEAQQLARKHYDEAAEVAINQIARALTQDPLIAWNEGVFARAFRAPEME